MLLKSFKQKLRFLLFNCVCLGFSISAMASTDPPCYVDNVYGGNARVTVARSFSNLFFSAPSFSLTSYMGDFMNGQVSSGTNIVNNTGAPLSQVVIVYKGFAYWRQPQTGFGSFHYWLQRESVQGWDSTDINIDGNSGASLHYATSGTSDDYLSDSKVTPFVSSLSTGNGYFFAAINPQNPTVSFTDAGNGDHLYTASQTIPLPQNLTIINAGPLANGASIDNFKSMFWINSTDFDNILLDPFANHPDALPSGSAGTDHDYYYYIDAEIVGVGYDYGDAPTSYGSAAHAYEMCGNALFIGTTRADYELSNATGITATGDNEQSGYDNPGDPGYSSYVDEDITGPLYNTVTQDDSHSITVPYTNNNTDAYIYGWIDWNNNGSFEEEERASASVLEGTAGNVTLTWRKSGATAGEGTMPAVITSGEYTARVRIGTVQAQVELPSGIAINGEVEDFVVQAGDAALSVKFGKIQATNNNNTLKVDWNTLTETNNDYFEIEGSTDGKQFVSLAKVNSKAAGGNSDVNINYSFTQSVDAGTLAWTLSILGCSIAGAGFKRRKLAAAALTLGVITAIASCTKETDTLNTGEQNLFIRIAQVDKDGTKSYSTIVQAGNR